MSVAHGIAQPAAQFRGAGRSDEHDVDDGGRRHAADRRDAWQGGAPPGVQRAAGRGRFNHFLGGQGEEKHHPDVVDRELERVCDTGVAGVRQVRPDERDQRAEREDERMFDETSRSFCEARDTQGILCRA